MAMGNRGACGLLALLLVACAAEQSQDSGHSVGSRTVAPSVAPDGHTSRDALDWPGRYEGFLPCADCPATFAALILEPDGGFKLNSRPLLPSGIITNVEGRFSWLPDGGTIALDAGADDRRFLVGEGRLLLLGEDGSRPQLPASLGVLGQRAPSPAASGSKLADDLQTYDWSLLSAADAGGAPITALLPADGLPLVLGFAGSRARVDGGCNALVGGYRLDADARLHFQDLAATLMACEPALMAIDIALGEALAVPLDVVLARGAWPVLALVTAAGEVLMFAGQLTPQARYGPATTIFLEIAPQRLPCAQAKAADGLCLQVRKLEYDPQGLRVGSPGEFREFPGLIEGFSHEEGTRTVLRALRFQPSGESGGDHHVLDLVVESVRESS